MQAMSAYLQVSRSGYYAWLKRMDQADPDQENMARVKSVYLQNRRVYGYRRVTHALRQTYGVKLNHKAVYRLMCKLGLRSVARKRKVYKRFEQIPIFSSVTSRLLVPTRNGSPILLISKLDKAPYIFR